MRVGVFLFGGVEMDDAGAGPPAPTDRRYTNEQMWRATEQLLDIGVLSDRLGYDSYWLTEHHFQYEGYEVVPNGMLFSAILAERTERIRIGAMFNVVGQWHPLKLAEDFASCTTSPAAGASSAWAGAPCPVRPVPSAPTSAASTTPTPPPPTN
jgi:hypothetical protein